MIFFVLQISFWFCAGLLHPVIIIGIATIDFAIIWFCFCNVLLVVSISIVSMGFRYCYYLAPVRLLVS